MKLNKLTDQEKEVIINKKTEPPFSGEYDDFFEDGVFVCRQCDNLLYDSKAKFSAGCGWPAFDDMYADAVREVPDKDGRRVEIVCAKCEAHLGHIFRGEGLTPKNTRHCVNSLSIKFIPRDKKEKNNYY
jgi:methionine-R-sulfoxide reductase